MGFKKYIAAGLIGFAGYKLYQKKDDISQNVKHYKNQEKLIKDDITKIKSNINQILEQKDVLQDITKELNYKIRVFKDESQVRVDEINKRMAKYQDESK